MPTPGPVAYHVQSGRLTEDVISTGADQMTVSLIATNRSPDRPAFAALACDDVLLSVGPEIVRREQPDDAGGRVDHGTWIAEGVRAIVSDDAQIGP